MAVKAGIPESVGQKQPHPTQGKFEPTSAQKDVPYVSGKATPNKNVK